MKYRLANNQLVQKNYSSAENYLQALTNSIRSSEDKQEKYRHYDDLLSLYLKTNLEKVIVILKHVNRYRQYLLAETY